MIIEDVVQEIQDEMFRFYNLNVGPNVIKQFLKIYHFDRIEEDPDYDGYFCFDTTEREDLIYYLEELGLIKLS
jgi:hypothetical protein